MGRHQPQEIPSGQPCLAPLLPPRPSQGLLPFGPFGKGHRGQVLGSFCISPCKQSHGQDRTTEFQTSSHFPVASAPSPRPPTPQPQGLREQIPQMLVAGGRTKEVSWREVSRVKKELENMPPPTPVNYWQGKGKEGVTELTQLNPSPPPGTSICNW